MDMGRASVWSVGLFLLVGACSSGVDLRAINPRVIRDSSGASFRWVCSQNACKIELDADTPSPPLCFGERGYYAHLGYRFLVVFPDWDCAQGPAPVCEVGPGFGRLTALSLSASTTVAVAVSARTRARSRSGSTSTPRSPCACGIHRAPGTARIHRQPCRPS